MNISTQFTTTLEASQVSSSSMSMSSQTRYTSEMTRVSFITSMPENLPKSEPSSVIEINCDKINFCGVINKFLKPNGTDFEKQRFEKNIQDKSLLIEDALKLNLYSLIDQLVPSFNSEILNKTKFLHLIRKCNFS
jgi:hypothetical protein